MLFYISLFISTVPWCSSVGFGFLIYLQWFAARNIFKDLLTGYLFIASVSCFIVRARRSCFLRKSALTWVLYTRCSAQILVFILFLAGRSGGLSHRFHALMLVRTSFSVIDQVSSEHHFGGFDGLNIWENLLDGVRHLPSCDLSKTVYRGRNSYPIGAADIGFQGSGWSGCHNG